MIVTVKEPKEVWVSPDGLRKIWELKDQDGNMWQTMSQRIAQAEGQTLDLTTRVSKNGKTYLITPPDATQPQTSAKAAENTSGPESAQVFFMAVRRFEKAISQLVGTLGPVSTIEEELKMKSDDDDLPPASIYEDQMGTKL